MVSSCSAYGCVNRQIKGTKNHFFKFPIQNPQRNAKWTKAVGRKGFIPSKNSLLCNEHFLNSDFKTPVGTKRKWLLRDDAVPSIFKTTVKYTPRKIYYSAVDEQTSSQLNITQQSDIFTNVSDYSDTTEFYTSVQDEPSRLSPTKNVCFKSAEAEALLIVIPKSQY